ncbi:MAG TPA: hypothetical protein VGF73_05815, partial [Chthoniobacterales bacterium]
GHLNLSFVSRRQAALTINFLGQIDTADEVNVSELSPVIFASTLLARAHDVDTSHALTWSELAPSNSPEARSHLAMT